jgi:putative membrane protein
MNSTARVGARLFRPSNMSISQLPALNAILNSVSAILLMTGYLFIRQKKIKAHRASMISAFVTSTLFLTSYLIYHFSKELGPTRFRGEGIIRPVYFFILITHTTLAITIVPMVFVTFSRALKKRFDLHRKIARWTLPIWLYVSVTGVIVYLMLYQLY